MITFTSLDGAACTCDTGNASFAVFPATPKKGAWSLLSNPQEEMADKQMISWPGEYDFAGMTVRAVGQEDGKQVSYACNSGGIRVAFVDAPVLEWSDTDIEKLGDIDVLVVAADNPKKVLALVETIDPRVILLTPTKGGDMAGVAKACGQASMQPVSEFKVKVGSLPQDSRQVVVLEK